MGRGNCSRNAGASSKRDGMDVECCRLYLFGLHSIGHSCIVVALRRLALGLAVVPHTGIPYFGSIGRMGRIESIHASIAVLATTDCTWRAVAGGRLGVV